MPLEHVGGANLGEVPLPPYTVKPPRIPHQFAPLKITIEAPRYLPSYGLATPAAVHMFVFFIEVTST